MKNQPTPETNSTRTMTVLSVSPLAEDYFSLQAIFRSQSTIFQLAYRRTRHEESAHTGNEFDQDNDRSFRQSSGRGLLLAASDFQPFQAGTVPSRQPCVGTSDNSQMGDWRGDL